jgi:hypothetical protein
MTARTLEDAWLDIERQRLGMARYGVLPPIVTVEHSADDGENCIVIVGLDNGDGAVHIASGFDPSTIAVDSERYKAEAYAAAMAVLDGIKEARDLFNRAPALEAVSKALRGKVRTRQVRAAERGEGTR